VRFLAIIPARAGSKGIPHKNLREVGGQPLVRIAATMASAVPHVELVLVSTDSATIARAALPAAGWLGPRPEPLSNDTAMSIDVWAHEWTRAEMEFGVQFDAGLLLEPTCPLRHVDDVIAVCNAIQRGANTAVTVTRTKHSYLPEKQLIISDKGSLEPMFPGPMPQRQAVEERWHVNGACYGGTRQAIVEDKDLFATHCEPVKIDRLLVNIDEWADLQLAQLVATHPEILVHEEDIRYQIGNIVRH